MRILFFITTLLFISAELSPGNDEPAAGAAA